MFLRPILRATGATDLRRPGRHRPLLLFDDDGKVYFLSNGNGCMSICEIDIRTGEKLAPTRPSWRGTGGRYPEAPHLYKIDGMYYMMIAEGGTEYGHMETIARSASPTDRGSLRPATLS